MDSMTSAQWVKGFNSSLLYVFLISWEGPFPVLYFSAMEIFKIQLSILISTLKPTGGLQGRWGGEIIFKNISLFSHR